MTHETENTDWRPAGSTYVSPDAIRLSDILKFVWHWKFALSSIVGATVFGAVLLALALPDVYRAEAQISRVTQGAGDDLGGLARQFGGLAGLGGVSLRGLGGGGPDVGVALAKITSRGFVHRFIERHQILPELMAIKSWDPVSGELRYDDEVFDAATRTWTREAEPPETPWPSNEEAYEEFLDILQIDEDLSSGVLTVSLDHVSPILAASWVNSLIADLNEEMREIDVERAERSIAYLNEQIADTSIAELRAVFFELVQGQMETVMLARANPDYVFQVVDPAVPLDEPEGPFRALIVFAGLVFGFLLGVVVLSVITVLRPSGSQGTASE